MLSQLTKHFLITCLVIYGFVFSYLAIISSWPHSPVKPLLIKLRYTDSHLSAAAVDEYDLVFAGFAAQCRQLPRQKWLKVQMKVLQAIDEAFSEDCWQLPVAKTVHVVEWALSDMLPGFAYLGGITTARPPVANDGEVSFFWTAVWAYLRGRYMWTRSSDCSHVASCSCIVCYCAVFLRNPERRICIWSEQKSCFCHLSALYMWTCKSFCKRSGPWGVESRDSSPETGPQSSPVALNIKQT